MNDSSLVSCPSPVHLVSLVSLATESCDRPGLSSVETLAPRTALGSGRDVTHMVTWFLHHSASFAKGIGLGAPLGQKDLGGKVHISPIGLWLSGSCGCPWAGELMTSFCF